MDPITRWLDSRFALLTACVAAAIVYGSLFPFQYRPNGSAIQILLATARTPLSQSELAANILFYVPLGLAAAAALRRIPGWAKFLLAGLGGSLLSAGMELAQAYSVGRSPDLWDLYANAAGSFLGAAVGAFCSSKSATRILGGARNRPFVWLLLALWLGYQLFPYWFSGDPRRLEQVFANLVHPGHFSWLDLFQKTVVWLAVALLLEALAGAARSRMALGWVMISVLLLRTMIGGALPSPEQIWGGAIAVFLWGAIGWRWTQRCAVVALLFVIYVALVALAPYQFLTSPRRFGLIPFVSFLNGGRDSGAWSFLEKAFTYGTLVWIVVRAGWKLGRAALSTAALVLVLRVVQIYLPGRSAESTDAILTLAMAGVMGLLKERPGGEQPQAPGAATKRYPIPRTVTK